jgi:hypothetical protein
MITGKEKPTAARSSIGPTAQLAVVDQTREALPNDKTVGKRSPAGRTS